jgi:hypothetical protein
VLSANANRRFPGVKVPVAAPSWSVVFERLASCCNVRPFANGKPDATGRSAAARRSTAAGNTPVAWPLVDVLDVVAALAGEACEDEPQPVSRTPIAASATTTN